MNIPWLVFYPFSAITPYLPLNWIKRISPSSLEPISANINDHPRRVFFSHPLRFAFSWQLLLCYHCHQCSFSPLHIAQLLWKLFFFMNARKCQSCLAKKSDIEKVVFRVRCFVLHSPHPCSCALNIESWELWMIKTLTTFWLQKGQPIISIIRWFYSTWLEVCRCVLFIVFIVLAFSFIHCHHISENIKTLRAFWLQLKEGWSRSFIILL